MRIDPVEKEGMSNDHFKALTDHHRRAAYWGKVAFILYVIAAIIMFVYFLVASPALAYHTFRKGQGPCESLTCAPSTTETWADHPRPTYKTEEPIWKNGRIVRMRVLEVSNLYPHPELNAQGAKVPRDPLESCHPDEAVGRVIRLQYDKESELSITGVTIQTSEGYRRFYNIVSDRPTEDVPMVTMGWINRGLETLLRVGRTARIGYYMCGAAGRVWYIHSIR
jgi:hypothetical protein